MGQRVLRGDLAQRYALGLPTSEYVAPVISDDGATLGYSYAGFVGSGEYVYQGQKIDAAGKARLSRNGRYGLRGWNQAGADAMRIDLSTGEVGPLSRSVWGLTDSGALLTQRDNSLYLGPPGEDGRLVATFPGKLLDAVLDANGSQVMHVVQHDGLLDLRKGNSVVVSLSDSGTSLRAELSSDGSRLLVIEQVLNTSHAFWVQRGLPGRNDLGAVRDGSATISGDGRVAWLVQNDGRLVRVRLDSGERELMSEALPARVTVLGAPVRGSLNRWSGAGVGEANVPAARVTGWAVNLVSQAQPLSLRLPALETKPDYVDFQIPWNLSETYSLSWMGLHRPAGVFEIVLPLQTAQIAPQFWPEPIFYTIPIPPGGSVPLAKVVHQGFDRLVTPGDPAQAGEVVHVYMSGLGAVAPVQTDNTPAPDPPPTATTPLTCLFGNVSARVLFAGLAVGMVGVYQVELEIPRGVLAPVVSCTVSTPQGSRGATGYLPVAN